MFIQFADSTEAAIIACFAEPQPASIPNQGTVTQSDTRWSAFYASLPAFVQVNLPTPTTPAAPSLAQQAATLIEGGITITSTGTPALNGTYSTNATAQQNAANIMGYITRNQKFPGTNPSGLPWETAAGAPVVFPSIAEFTAFYNAGMDFVLDCRMIILSNSGTLPAATATIP